MSDLLHYTQKTESTEAETKTHINYGRNKTRYKIEQWAANVIQVSWREYKKRKNKRVEIPRISFSAEAKSATTNKDPTSLTPPSAVAKDIRLTRIRLAQLYGTNGHRIRPSQVLIESHGMVDMNKIHDSNNDRSDSDPSGKDFDDDHVSSDSIKSLLDYDYEEGDSDDDHQTTGDSNLKMTPRYGKSITYSAPQPITQQVGSASQRESRKPYSADQRLKLAQDGIDEKLEKVGNTIKLSDESIVSQQRSERIFSSRRPKSSYSHPNRNVSGSYIKDRHHSSGQLSEEEWKELTSKEDSFVTQPDDTILYSNPENYPKSYTPIKRASVTILKPPQQSMSKESKTPTKTFRKTQSQEVGAQSMPRHSGSNQNYELEMKMEEKSDSVEEDINEDEFAIKASTIDPSLMDSVPEQYPTGKFSLDLSQVERYEEPDPKERVQSIKTERSLARQSLIEQREREREQTRRKTMEEKRRIKGDLFKEKYNQKQAAKETKQKVKTARRIKSERDSHVNFSKKFAQQQGMMARQAKFALRRHQENNQWHQNYCKTQHKRSEESQRDDKIITRLIQDQNEKRRMRRKHRWNNKGIQMYNLFLNLVHQNNNILFLQLCVFMLLIYNCHNVDTY